MPNWLFRHELLQDFLKTLKNQEPQANWKWFMSGPFSLEFEALDFSEKL